MDVYDIAGACERVRDHLEVLTNWYVRRSRDRFWAGDADAIDTLHTVLEVDLPGGRAAAAADHGGDLAGADRRAVGAPGRLAGAADALPHDAALVAAMDRVRAGGVGGAVAAQGRAGCACGCRWPGSPWPRADAERAGAVRRHPARRGERQGRRADRRTSPRYGRFEVAVNARACGPRLGGDTQKVIRAVKAGEWTANADGTVTAGGIELLRGGVHRAAGRRPTRTATAALPGNTGLVVLDTAVTPELAAEGTAPRRRAAWCSRPAATPGWTSSDRIALTLDGPGPVLDAVRAHEAFVAGEVLATRWLRPGAGADPGRHGLGRPRGARPRQPGAR